MASDFFTVLVEDGILSLKYWRKECVSREYYIQTNCHLHIKITRTTMKYFFTCKNIRNLFSYEPFLKILAKDAFQPTSRWMKKYR